MRWRASCRLPSRSSYHDAIYSALATVHRLDQYIMYLCTNLLKSFVQQKRRQAILSMWSLFKRCQAIAGLYACCKRGGATCCIVQEDLVQVACDHDQEQPKPCAICRSPATVSQAQSDINADRKAWDAVDVTEPEHGCQPDTRAFSNEGTTGEADRWSPIIAASRQPQIDRWFPIAAS